MVTKYIHICNYYDIGIKLDFRKCLNFHTEKKN